jgi:hypothetical protein
MLNYIKDSLIIIKITRIIIIIITITDNNYHLISIHHHMI